MTIEATYEMPLHLLDLNFDRAKGLAEHLALLHDGFDHTVLHGGSREWGMEKVRE